MLLIVVKDIDTYLKLKGKALKKLLTCSCGQCEFILWGTYTRKPHSSKDKLLIVQRVRCKICKKTHAVLPSFILGQVRHTAETVQTYLEKWIETGHSLSRLWLDSNIPKDKSTVYRWRRRFRWTLCGFVGEFTNQALVHQSGY